MGHLQRLPAHSFDVAVLPLLLSVLPGPDARAAVIAKVRKLLRKGPDRGLLIVADTAKTIGRHNDRTSRTGSWVRAVEAAGFKLLHDPQMHLSRKHEPSYGGFVQRAACWSFVTAPMEPGTGVGELHAHQPLLLLSEERTSRGLPRCRAEAQA